MDVWEESKHPWLIEEKAAIRQWVGALGRPYLGICLGHQLLADALGGSVGLMQRPEVGLGRVTLDPAVRTDRLFSGLESPLTCVQWHGAEIKSLPPRSVVLASNEYSPIQAMRHGPNAYGTQFHVEVTSSTVPEWADVPEYCVSLEAVAGAGAVQRFETAVMEHLPTLERNAAVFFDNFMAVVQSSAT